MQATLLHAHLRSAGYASGHCTKRVLDAALPGRVASQVKCVCLSDPAIVLRRATRLISHSYSLREWNAKVTLRYGV